MKASQIAVLAAAVLVLVLVLGSEAEVSMAAAAAGGRCNPGELSPCAEPIQSGAPPSAICCAKMKQQQPCFCSYLKNPSLKPYVSSPNARKCVTACKVAIPKC